MDVQLETPSAGSASGKAAGLLRQIRVKIPAQQVSRALDERLKAIAGRAKIPGFRPGKAPMTIVQQQFGPSALNDVVQDLVRSSYPEAVDKVGVRPASAPSFELTAEKPGEPLEYLARFEVYPEIKLKALDKLKIVKPKVEVTDADVDKLLESLRRNRKTLNTVERAAKDGDTVTVNFEGSIDGELFPGGKGENTEIEVGAGRFLPELDKSFAGKKAGDSYSQDVTFPADYRATELQGKTAQFAVTVTKVQESVLPEVDAEFLKSHGVEEGAGVDGLRGKLRTALEGERDKAVTSRLKQQAMDQLLEHNPIEVPQGLLANELPRLRDEAAQRFNAAGLKPDQKLKLLPDEMLLPTAQRRVSLGLLVGEVLKEKKLTLNPEKLEALLTSMAAEYENPEQVKQHYRSRQDLMQGIRAIVLEEQVVEALIAGVKPSDEPMSLEDLLNPKSETK